MAGTHRSTARPGLGVPLLIAVLIAVLTAVLLVAASLPARAQPDDATPSDDLSDDIAAARSEAVEIADEIEELGARASAVLEQYRRAQATLDEADAELVQAQRRVADVRAQYESAKERAADRLVAMYQGSSTPSPLVFIDASDAIDLGVRRHYAELVADSDRAVVDELEAARGLLLEEQAALAAEREAFATEVAELEARRDEVESAMRERKRALARAEGELADLVAEEQRRRAAAEAARAREAARRRAEEEARRRATTSSTSTSTTLPGGAEAGDEVMPPPPEPPPPGLPPVHPRAGGAVQAALDEIGTPYEWGGNGPNSYDCSGLTTYAWSTVGVSLPRSSGLQKQALPPVPLEHIQPGDLLFFGNPVHHVGMFIGDGEMVNAPYTGTTVRIDSIWRSDFAGAGRPG